MSTKPRTDEAARDIATQRDLFRMSVSDPDSMQAAQEAQANHPELVAKTQHLIQGLIEEEEQKRKVLEQITSHREAVLIRTLEFQDRVLMKHSRLKKKEKMLSAQAGQLLRALKAEEMRVNKLSGTIHKLNKQRKQELGRITDPAWAVPHHYHMTATEHCMGHAQPHVLDVGGMIRGHLRIFAMANAGVRFQKNANHVLNKAKQARVKVSEQIKKVYRQLRIARGDIKEVEKLLEGLKERLGHRPQLQQLRAKMKEQQQKRDSQKQQEQKQVEEVKQKQLEDAVDSDKIVIEDVATETKQPSTPSHYPLEPRFDTPFTKARVSTGSSAQGYRNIKMRFFQALNLTPPDLRDAILPPPPVLKETSDENPGENESAVSAASLSSAPEPPTPSSEESMAADWQEFADLLKDLEPLDKAKQSAWEELELVLDSREKLKFEMGQLSKAASGLPPAAPSSQFPSDPPS